MTEHHRDVELLSALLDDDLEPGQAAEVRGHVDTCDRCRQVLEQLAAIREAAAGLEQLDPAPATWFEIQRRIQKRRRPRLAWFWAGVPAAAAAAVLVVVLVGSQPEKKPRIRAVAIEEPTTDEEAADALAHEYDEYLRGIDEALRECRAAMAENPRNPRVRLAYLNAHETRMTALDRLASGGH